MSVLIGSKFADVIRFTAESDIAYGFGGNDRIYEFFGPISNDMFYGGDGSDTLITYSGHDSLYGGKGDDFVYIEGITDNLTLRGGAGNDTLYIDADLVAPGELPYLLDYAKTGVLIQAIDGHVIDIKGFEVEFIS